jgi:serine/threonine protein kinase
MFIHSMDIIHRDLKPENLLFITTGGIKTWKLADFGSSSKKGIKIKNTNTIKYAFTPDYASIE